MSRIISNIRDITKINKYYCNLEDILDKGDLTLFDTNIMLFNFQNEVGILENIYDVNNVSRLSVPFLYDAISSIRNFLELLEKNNNLYTIKEVCEELKNGFQKLNENHKFIKVLSTSYSYTRIKFSTDKVENCLGYKLLRTVCDEYWSLLCNIRRRLIDIDHYKEKLETIVRIIDDNGRVDFILKELNTDRKVIATAISNAINSEVRILSRDEDLPNLLKGSLNLMMEHEKDIYSNLNDITMHYFRNGDVYSYKNDEILNFDPSFFRGII